MIKILLISIIFLPMANAFDPVKRAELMHDDMDRRGLMNKCKFAHENDKIFMKSATDAELTCMYNKISELNSENLKDRNARDIRLNAKRRMREWDCTGETGKMLDICQSESRK